MSHQEHCGKSEEEKEAEWKKSKPFVCSKCTWESFPSKCAMEAHAAVCGKTEEEVAQELAEWQAEKKSYTCRTCNKAFQTQWALAAHADGCGKSEAELQAEYELWIPYVCVCGKRFSREAGKGGLLNHRNACEEAYRLSSDSAMGN